MPVIDQFIEKAKSAGRHIVLPEGQDPRVVKAAEKLVNDGVAEITVIGSEAEINAAAAEANVAKINFQTIDPATSELLEEFSVHFQKLRAKKNLSLDQARQVMLKRIFFGAMMTRQGLADGLTAGSISSTANMLRAAFTVIGTAPGIKTGSSCFVMDLARPTIAGEQTLLFADCAVNPDPDAEQLADIAIATASTYQSLFDRQAKIAFLSFATKGSAQHPSLEKIVKATAITKERIAQKNINAIADGELQADAALVPKVAQQKCPGADLRGDANVLIFPDLNSGNICYKTTQRLGEANAYGPILQGLAKPLNDLSRGCSWEDIYGVAAITVCQSCPPPGRPTEKIK